MVKFIPHDLLINNLLGKYQKDNVGYYMPKERAYKYLKHITNQDFGYDAYAWEKWFDEEEHPYRNFTPLIDTDNFSSD